MTETTGAAFRLINPEEYGKWGAVGKLSGTNEAKIVDLETGIALPSGKQGELWLRGPTIMKGNQFILWIASRDILHYIIQSKCHSLRD